ncbi:CLUMA_CG019280, isoform A [Clunio marinus]|uniref:CLUMA_CG019280, isoform A n=1 Tax=Clunio marinus TaxID=568069 RepID=A0A1J1J474_9DIPT|nr:CLUMA_CG019280, isoform A [Clunio marinus]
MEEKLLPQKRKVFCPFNCSMINPQSVSSRQLNRKSSQNLKQKTEEKMSAEDVEVGYRRAS